MGGVLGCHQVSSGPCYGVLNPANGIPLAWIQQGALARGWGKSHDFIINMAKV